MVSAIRINDGTLHRNTSARCTYANPFFFFYITQKSKRDSKSSCSSSSLRKITNIKTYVTQPHYHTITLTQQALHLVDDDGDIVDWCAFCFFRSSSFNSKERKKTATRRNRYRIFEYVRSKKSLPLFMLCINSHYFSHHIATTHFMIRTKKKKSFHSRNSEINTKLCHHPEFAFLIYKIERFTG